MSMTARPVVDGLAAELEAAQFLAANLKNATGNVTADYGEVTGEAFQMMTMCSAPERLADAINRLPDIAAALAKPTEQATSPAPDAVLREAIDWLHRNADGLKSDIALAHRSRGNGCTEWMREDDRDFRRDLDKHLAALASSKPTGCEGEV